jgi:hypothetical protein
MQLVDLLKHTPPTIYAALDAVQVERIAYTLDVNGFERHALYRGRHEDQGIQLVPLQTAEQIDGFLALFSDPAPAVFWSWPGNTESIFRHLRSLGEVEVPGGADPDGSGFGRVLFRHADPHSLIRVLRVLTEDQRNAFFGQARGLLLQHSDLRGRETLTRATRDGRLLTGPVAGATSALGQPE